ncbi:MAG: hypothetical protein EBS76_08715, partial [Actinobacteria bacterium]|nr:hypothetical protein [Actinomycetota bacterium]
MANTKINKGLAIASATSLALIGLSAPAGAAGLADKSYVSTLPTTGTGYAVVAGDAQTFSLTSNEAVSIDGGGNLKWLLSDSDAGIYPTGNTSGVTYAAEAGAAFIVEWVRTDGVVTVTYDDNDHGIVAGELIQVSDALEIDDANAAADHRVVEGYYRVTAVDGTDVTFTDIGDVTEDVVLADTTANAADEQNFQGEIIASGLVPDADDSYSLVIDSGANDGTADETLEFIVEDSATRTVSVTAWVDSNGNGEIDATEYTSATRTVAFHGVADLTPSITWTARKGVAPSAVFTFAEALNAAQTAAGDFTAAWTNGGGVDLSTPTYAWDADDSTITVGEATVLAAGDLGITLKNAAGDDIATFGTEVVDNDVEYMTVTAVASDDVAAGARPAAGADFTGTVRSDKNVDVTVTVYNTDDEAVAGVTVVVDDQGVDGVTAAGVYKVGAKAVAANGTFDAFNLVTDANGQVTVTVSAIDDTTAADTINLLFTADGITAGLAADDDKDARAAIDLTYADTNYTADVVSIVSAHSGQPANAAGDGLRENSYNALVWVVDQWDVAPANGAYRIKSTAAQDDESVASYVNVVGGYATVNVADNADADGGLITATMDLQVYSAANAAFANEDVAFDTVYVQPYTSAIEGRVTFADDAPAAVAVGTAALNAANTKTGDAAPAGLGADVTLTGTVKNDATGANVKGAKITFSGPSNLLFKVDGVYSYGSITAYVGDAGDFTVDIYSTTSGEFTVTATSLGGSDEATVTFSGPLKGAGTVLTVDVSNLKPGMTGTVTGKLVDQFGNAVDTATGDTDQLKITWNGPGLITSTLPNDFDTNGEFKFYVLLGSNDTVSGTVVVSYDKDDDGSFTDTGTVSVTTDLAPAAAADTKVNAGSFKGYVAIYAKGH